ncbi:sporulation-delaying protein SdpB family protein [Kitasatospora sp. NPDC048540]|uniref:sporulation-delaying protein SdpB family protein n=1 Tax=Kitasatospora sp. NPDC048540 TaxID=3155634 RepID=UPI0033FC881A
MRPPSTALGRRLATGLAGFAPGPGIAAGRSLLALTQLLTLLCTPDAALFAHGGYGPLAPYCDGSRALGLWCLGPADGTMTARRAVAALALAVIASGYRPRWTCLPHWYLTFSLTTATGLADGGDMAARIATLLLAVILLGDTRRWHWRRTPGTLPPQWRGAGYAAHLLLRAQILIIYGQAGLSKLLDPVWRQGTAMYYTLHSHYWGAPAALRPWTDPLVGHGWSVRLLGWSVIALELALAAGMLLPAGARRAAVPGAVALHAGIIALMGLFGFGLTMIALVLAAAAERRCTTDVTGGHTEDRSRTARAAVRPTLDRSSEQMRIQGELAE